MKKQFLVNGKVTYPQNGGAMTTFYFIQQETQESFSISTTEEAEAEALNYGDIVTVRIEKTPIEPENAGGAI